jgi:hypothetical protein
MVSIEERKHEKAQSQMIGPWRGQLAGRGRSTLDAFTNQIGFALPAVGMIILITITLNAITIGYI